MTRSRTSAPVYADTQGYLVISSAPATNQGVVGKTLIEAGALNVEGAYECEIASDGLNVMQVELKPSAVTGSFAPSLKGMRYHGAASARSSHTDAGANFIAGTSEVLEVTDLKGMKVCKVTFTVPSSGSVTFAPGADPASPAAIAEYNGL